MLIRLTLPTLLTLGGTTVELKPGINEVAAESWRRVADAKTTRALIDSGAIVVVEDDSAGGEIDIVARKAADVVALVRETTDAELLRRWAEQDNRATVQSAIADRLAELKPEKPEP